MKKLTTWNNGPLKRCSLLDENETVIAVGIEVEDAQRIVACVNALKGYTTKNIEGVDFKSSHDSLCDLLEIAIAERDKERAVREELLEACKEAVGVVVSNRTLDLLLKAIALAEGGDK